MLLSAVSVLVVAQSSSEIPEGLMNNPVYRLMPETVLAEEDVYITIKYFPFYVLLLVNGSRLTSNGSFEVIFLVVLCITLMQINSQRN